MKYIFINISKLKVNDIINIQKKVTKNYVSQNILRSLKSIRLFFC